MSDFLFREASARDGHKIAAVRAESIATLGAGAYPDEALRAWAASEDGTTIAAAMKMGERCFLAVHRADPSDVVGLSTWLRDAGVDRVAVYVVARAARQRVGTLLFRAVEAAARAAGAQELCADASVSAMPFYLSCGFRACGEGERVLTGGAPLRCVFMKKAL